MTHLNTFSEIDLDALSHNLGIVKKKTKNKKVLAVVKANAYGHGAVRVSRHLLKSGASMLGVALIKEALKLREAGIKAPILVFFDTSDIDAFFEYDLTPVVFDHNHAKAFAESAYRRNRR
ncbi:MAG: alanine racemase, partial [Nitrospirae bacterium]|nr:alanine racemase [Nitrospirota bacterium]